VKNYTCVSHRCSCIGVGEEDVIEDIPLWQWVLPKPALLGIRLRSRKHGHDTETDELDWFHVVSVVYE
jgi:hypothetical protein